MWFATNTPGVQTLAIRKRSSGVLDPNGLPVPVADRLIPKTGCMAETQRPAESEALITTISEIAWFFLPVDDDSRAITPDDAIDFDGRTYELRGPRVIECGIDGEEVQVWCIGEWQKKRKDP